MTVRTLLLLVYIIGIGRAASAQQAYTVQQQFRSQLNKLQGYLTIIASQKITANDKQQAIEQTLAMFEKEGTVQVSIGRTQKHIRTYSINEYVQNLSLLGYIRGTFQFSALSLQPAARPSKDSSEHFIGSFRQTFRGHKASGTYADVIRKTVEVILLPTTDPFSDVTDWAVRFKTIQIRN